MRLDVACSHIVDCEHKTAPIDESGSFFAVGTPAMKGHHINYSDARRISRETFDLWTRRLRPAPGDLLLAREAPVGPIVQLPDEANVAPGQRTVLLRPNPQLTDSRFLYYALSSPASQVALQVKAEGSTVHHLNVPDIRSFELDVPPLREQQAIAEVLGALDDKIAANTLLSTTAEELLRTEIDSAWLQGPERDALLIDFVELNPPRTRPDDIDALYVDMKKLPESGWSIDAPDRRDAKGGARFQRGDTLLARITPCLENRKTGYVDNLADGETAIGSTEFIVARSRDGVAAPISFLLLTEARFREFAIQHMVGTSGRQRVAASDLERFEMPRPDEDWLRRFGAQASALFAHVESLRNENRTLAKTRDALLPQLMSGKLRVRDAERIAEKAGA